MGKSYNYGRFDFLIDDEGRLLEIHDRTYGVKYNAYTALAFEQIFLAAAKILNSKQRDELLEELTEESFVIILKGLQR